MLSIISENQLTNTGEIVTLYTLSNNFLEITTMNFGATITSIKMPDRNGRREEIVLGFSDVNSYIDLGNYFGATVGRVAGRLTKGNLTIGQKDYSLKINEGQNHLHGGGIFNQRIWKSETFKEENRVGVEYRLESLDGEAGYPGNLIASVIISLDNNNQLSIEYGAFTDKKTVYNPTNHTYFNLSGNLVNDVSKHILTMPADKFVPLTEELLPTGELVDVTGTTFDFRDGLEIGDGIKSSHIQNEIVKGYDHAFIFDSAQSNHEFSLWEPKSGRKVLAKTDMPSVVVYSGNQLQGEYTVVGKPTIPYSGITLETQFLPDTPNNEGFGSIELNPETKFESTTSFTFMSK